MTKAWSSQIQHHPKRKAFQCKHISNEMFIEAIMRTHGGNHAYERSAWRMRWDVEETLRTMLGDSAPIGLAKVMMAKFYKLEKKGIVHGCSCGCRGDYHLSDGTCC